VFGLPGDGINGVSNLDATVNVSRLTIGADGLHAESLVTKGGDGGLPTRGPHPFDPEKSRIFASAKTAWRGVLVRLSATFISSVTRMNWRRGRPSPLRWKVSSGAARNQRAQGHNHDRLQSCHVKTFPSIDRVRRDSAQS
jgi:hypothetical protein